MWANRSGRSPKMSNVSKLLRPLTKNEQMGEFPALKIISPQNIFFYFQFLLLFCWQWTLVNLYIYIKPGDLLVDQLIGELRGYGPLDNAGRQSLYRFQSIGLLFHWIVEPIFCAGCNNYISLHGWNYYLHKLRIILQLLRTWLLEVGGKGEKESRSSLGQVLRYSASLASL